MERKAAAWVVMQDFIESRDCSEKTKVTYRRVLAIYRQWLQSRRYDYTRITRDKAEEFKQYIVARSTGTYAVLVIYVVKTFYAYYEEEHLHSYSELYRHDCLNSWRKVKVSGARASRKGIVEADEVARMICYLREDGNLKAQRNALIVSMLYTLALRRMELRNIKIEDIDIQRSRIHIRRKRQDVKVWISVPARLMEEITSYAALSQEEYLFGYNGQPISDRQISTIVKKAFQYIGKPGEEYSCHSLRHSAAVIAWSKTHDIYAVKTMLGHKDVQTTQIYLQALEESLRENNPVVNVISDSLSEALKCIENNKNQVKNECK